MTLDPPPYRFTAGSAPLLVSMPHGGTALPEPVAARMTEAGRLLADTDWHIARLYDFLEPFGASVIEANYSRYFVDLNRDPAGAPLYPGASETGLCPTTTFAEEPIYKAGQEPDSEEIADRRAAVWQPYHDRIAAELSAIRERHGIALLWDAHSIRSRVPRFFEGRLPDLNIGAGGGVTAAPELIGLLTAVARDAGEIGYSHAVDGRFKGGFITRNYGRPEVGVHAVQLELSQITYMDEEPLFEFRENRARKVRPVLAGLIQSAIAWAELETGAPS